MLNSREKARERERELVENGDSMVLVKNGQWWHRENDESWLLIDFNTSSCHHCDDRRDIEMT